MFSSCAVRAIERANGGLVDRQVSSSPLYIKLLQSVVVVFFSCGHFSEKALEKPNRPCSSVATSATFVVGTTADDFKKKV